MSDVPSRALRDTLRDQLERPPSGCLDAETLAAWCDGTLSRNDRAIAESHAATCARCQTILAAMAKTAPLVSLRRWWQTATVRWLVPVAAVSSLAIAVWMNRPVERSEARPEARLQLEPAAPSAPAAASETPPARERAKQEREERSAVQTSPPAALEAPAAKSAPSAAAADRDEAAPPPAPPSPSAASPALAPVAKSFETALAETIVIVPPQQRTANRSAAFDIRSPNQDVRWRIVAGVTVERSTDGGTTWQAQSTGVTGRLTAGAAPSRMVCWIVGSGGVVLVSKDGQTWQRVEFPEVVDLVAIVAQNDSSATVTAADGRMFSTTDGGKTWR